MSRGRRGRIRKDIPSTETDRSSVLLVEDRDWDSDEFSAYDIAVSTILEALEGLWFDSDDFETEREVNEHVQKIKKEIQENL